MEQIFIMFHRGGQFCGTKGGAMTSFAGSAIKDVCYCHLSFSSNCYKLVYIEQRRATTIIFMHIFMHIGTIVGQ